MKKHNSFVPKLRRNYILAVSTVLFVLAAAALWRFREALSLASSDLMIISGMALLMAVLTISHYMNKKENFTSTEERVKMQQEIGTSDYNDSSIFFREPPDIPE